jgi:hypothetical protein
VQRYSARCCSGLRQVRHIVICVMALPWPSPQRIRPSSNTLIRSRLMTVTVSAPVAASTASQMSGRLSSQRAWNSQVLRRKRLGVLPHAAPRYSDRHASSPPRSSSSALGADESALNLETSGAHTRIHARRSVRFSIVLSAYPWADGSEQSFHPPRQGFHR